MEESPSIWTGEAFEKAIEDIAEGNQITSRQYNSLANAWNQRITSGLGDVMWRTLWYLHTLVSDISRRTTLNFWDFPRNDEWWSHDLFLEQAIRETISKSPSFNPDNPLWAFRDGWKDGSVIRGESDRFTGNPPFGISINQTPAKIWEDMKTRRGTISNENAIDRVRGCRTFTEDGTEYAARVKDVDLHGLPTNSLTRNAREVLQLPRGIRGYYNRLKSYGGRIEPTSPGTLDCRQPDEQEERELPEQPTPDQPQPGNPGEPPSDYPGVPSPPPIGNEDEDDREKDLEGVQGDYRGDYLAGSMNLNATAWDFLLHERGAQYEMIMTAFLAEFRGLNPVGSRRDGIRNSAFDFKRFFASQYLFAPAKGYPAISAGWKGADGVNFVVAGVMVKADDDVQFPMRVNLQTESEAGGETTTQSVSLNLTEEVKSAVQYFPGGAVKRVRVISCVSTDENGQQTTHSGFADGVSGEYYEALKMRPKVYDAYMLLRIRQATGIGNLRDKDYSDDYFRHGASFGTAIHDANSDDPLDDFPPYIVFRRFIKSLARVHAYDRLVGYEVITEDEKEKSVLYFEKAPIRLLDGDMWDNMIHQRKVDAGQQGESEEWAFQITGSCPATPGTGTIFKETAYAQIRGAFSNPMWTFSECMQAPRYAASNPYEYPSRYLKARRRNMAYVLRGLPTDDYGTGRYMLYPEAPSGLNYKLAEDPNSRSMSSDEQKAYYRANRLFQAPIVVDSISYLDGDEFDSKFPSGVLQGAGSPNQIGEHDARPTGSVVKGEVVKVVLSSRLNRTPRAETQPVSNTGASWNAYSLHDRWLADNGRPHEITVGGGRVTFGGERSDENRIIELLIHRWRTYDNTLPNAFPIRRLGDFAPSATTSLASEPIGASNMGGNVFCRLGFLKLVPRVYKDDNDVSQRHDTRVYSHLFRHIEMLTRASCGAFFDLESNKNNIRHVPGTSGKNTRCEYLAPPKDYTMEHLVSERATAPQSGENLAIQKLEPSIPRSDGFGPIPNLEVTSGFFVEFAKVVNALLGCSIPGSFATGYERYSRSGQVCEAPEIFPDDCQVYTGPGCRQWPPYPGCVVPSTLWRVPAPPGIDPQPLITPEHPEGINDGNVFVYAHGNDAPLLSPWTASNPGTPTLPFYPPEFIADQDAFPDHCYPDAPGQSPERVCDFWGIFGAGSEGFAEGTRSYAVSPPSSSDPWVGVKGTSSTAVWLVTGTEEFLEAFNPLMRAYINKNSLGRPVAAITHWRHTTGTTTEIAPGPGQTGNRVYGITTDQETIIVADCQVLAGGTLVAPGLPGTTSALLSTYVVPVDGAGGHSSGLIHNIGASPEAVVVVKVKGTDDFQPPSCEIVLRVGHGAWYQVVDSGDEETDGAGIKYGLLPEDEYGERPVFLPGELFTAKRYPSSDAGITYERVFNQVDPSKPSKVCRRTDLPPPPDRFYTY